MYQIANYNLFSCFYTYKYLIIKYLWVFPINNRDFPTSL